MVTGALKVKRLLADCVDGLIVEDYRHLRVVQEPVSGEHGVVRLDDAGGNFGGGVDLKANLGLLAVVDRNSLQDESSKSRSSSASHGVMDDESLDILRVVHELAQAVVHLVKDLLSHSVVATREVVGGVFLAVKEELRVEHLRVFSSADVIDNGWLEINRDVPWDELPC